MLGKGIIAAYLLMAKLGLGSLIQWLVMEQIKVSFPYHANKFSTGFIPMKINKNNTKSMFPCYKSTTKKFKISLSLLVKGRNKDIKSDSIKL